MKHLFVLVLVIFSRQVGFSQKGDETKTVNSTIRTQESNDNKVYNTGGLDVLPEYPGGIKAFYDYIAKNYTPPSSKDFKGGKLQVAFVVEKDGSLTDIKVLRDPGFGTNFEAIRVLRACLNWKPGEINGNKVRCSYILPIILNGN